MTRNDSRFIPDWFEGALPSGSFRSLFKWGDPKAFKHPNRGLYNLMKETFGMSDTDFQSPRRLGLESVEDNAPVHMPETLQKEIIERFGDGNVHRDTYSRVRASYGKGCIDSLRLREHILENLPDLVVDPAGREDVAWAVQFCNTHRIPLYVFGGGSSVTRGMEAVKGGLTLDMSVHMNRVIKLNEVDQTIEVEAGMWGPKLEDLLQHAPEKLNAYRRYTAGHFPQSFEYSSVGGWVVTRGAGQNSTYYGKIEDIVVAQEYSTPLGVLKTGAYPRCATGPDFNQVMMGSEGTFGVLVSVTLRLRRWMPQNQRYYSFMFKDWKSSLKAAREIMQCEGGLPSVLRLSDPEETEIGMRLYGVQDTPANGLLSMLGYKPMERCLLLGTADGSRPYTNNIARVVSGISRRHGAFPMTGWVTKSWEHGRFRDPYLREDLVDHGIMIDTLECAVTWSQLESVYASVRKVVKDRPRTICMTHASHFYPQGTNLYFIFIARMEDIDSYLSLQYSILEAIQKSGAAMSHHHGMGKQTAPWLEEQIGLPQMDVLRALKEHFDPHGVMNPGGTLGLDMTEEQRSKKWGFRHPDGQ